MKKTVLTLFFAAALLVGAVLPVSAAENAQVTKGKQVATDAEKMTFPTDGTSHEATCPVCGTSATWLPLTPEAVEAGFTAAEANTHYYLTGSAESATAKITMFNSSMYTSCVHLNGKNITSTGDVAIEGKAGKLNIMGSGTVKGTGAGDNYSSPATVLLGNKGSVNLYGGTYEKYDAAAATNTVGIGWGGGTIAVYDGATIKAGTSGSAVYIDSTMGTANATLDIYGGVIVGGNASTVNTEVVATDATRKLTINMYAGVVKDGSTGYGGNLMLRNGVTFNMYGGTIQDGEASSGGGNIAVYGGSTMNLYGGTVKGGVAAANGGNIYLTNYVTDTDKKSSTFNMSGGTIQNGEAGTGGGNVYAYTSVIFNLCDGLITKGTANLSSTNYLTGGGNVFIYTDSTFNMSGGTISYGNANKGGNVGATKKATLNLTGGIIEYGTAKAEGGNLFGNADNNTAANRVNMNLTNVIIRNGTTTAGPGGNIAADRTNLNIGEGTQILNGAAKGSTGRGGNIRVYIGTVVMTGGKISGGSSVHADGTDEIWVQGESGNPSVMYMLGGVIEATEERAYSVRVDSIGRLYLGGNATIVNSKTGNAEIYGNGPVYICDGWSGSAAIHFSKSITAGENLSTSVIKVVALDGEMNATAGGRFTGKLLHTATGSILMSSGDASGTLVAGGMAVVDKDGKVTVTSDPLTLWATGEYAFIRLFSNYTVDVTDKNLWIDLNGLALTVTGSGTVNAFDTSSDAFAVPTGSVTADAGVAVSRDVEAPNGNRYLAVEEAGELTFHRLDIRISSVTLRPSAAGIYYKATYNCDTVLAAYVKAYGVVLSIYGMPGDDFKTGTLKCAYTVSSEPFASGVIANSGSVFGIMKTEREADVNRKYGELKIYANPYVQMGTEDPVYYMGDRENAGKTVDSQGFDGIALSLYDVLNRMDDQYYQFDTGTRRSIDRFCLDWQEKGMGSWTFENIGTEIQKFDNSNLKFTAGSNEAICPACEATVTWTPFGQPEDATVGIGTATNGTHYYLTEDITYTGTEAGFIANPTTKNEKACLHLNGHNLTATAHGAIYTPYAHAGILNVMGDGTVSGSRSGTGATVYLSSKDAAGSINLYGGTYVTSKGSALAAIVNGGSIHVYDGAWLKGSGSGNVAYVDLAKNAAVTFGVHGGKVTGGELAVAEDAGTKQRTFVIDGKAYVEALTIRNANVAVELSGAPVIDCIAMKPNTKLTVGELTEGASIGISTNKVFSNALENAQAYLSYFYAWNEPDSITVTDAGELYYSINYEHYMTPYEYDVKAKAIADGQIHYYFMAAKGMIMSPTNAGDIDKWGDSCLVVFPNGETMLIDSGYAIQAPVIIGSLKRMGVTTLDYLLITHPHSDHMGGAFGSDSTFLEEITVEQVYYQDLQYGSSWDGVLETKCDAKSIPYTALWTGDTLTFGEGDKAVTLTMLWPGEDADLTIDSAANNNSMVFRIDYGEHSSLFTADIYTATESKLCTMYTNGELDADMLKVPHHGLALSSSSLAFLQAVTPEIAVATGSFDINDTINTRYTSTDTSKGVGATLLEDRFHGYIHISSGTDGVMTTETE